MSGFEENEISKNANGGTEIIKRKLARLIDPAIVEDFQIISSRIRELQEDKIRILWSHDLPEDPEAAKVKDKNFRSKFHKMVFVSNWQYSRYQLIHGMPYDTDSIVIEHGIDPAPQSALVKDNSKIRIAYTSTPQRGLELLVPVFVHMAGANPNIHLDVFSSFNIYGWPDADKQFEPIFEICRNHPQITYHGFVPNDKLKEELNQCHIFAYPSIWMETACIALMEAMSAGLVCVHPNYAALSDTSGGLNIMYHGAELDKNKHANIFAKYLQGAIELVMQEKAEEMKIFNKMYVDNRFNINRAKNAWEGLLVSMKERYPDVKSRAFAKEMFTYKIG